MRIFPLIFLFLASVCFAQSTAELQPRMVKIYGAGGFAEMEEYQSGFLISADGLIATVFSPVLNTDTIDCVLSDGSRYKAELLGVEPIQEIALLKIERTTPFPFFDLAAAAARTKDQTLDGTPILALSNLFNVAVGNEPVSVQAGVISGTTQLEATRRAFATRYHGPVYILDVTTNNPGAAGGALVSADGKDLLGILGKELQNSRTGCWLNFALPAYVLQEGIQKIQSGEAQTTAALALADASDRKKPEKSVTLEILGLVMVPELVARTPAFIDFVRPDSRCARADLKADDLILYVNGRLIQSLSDLDSELNYIDFEDPIRVTILRGEEILEKEVK